MARTIARARWSWLVLGILAGALAAVFWPQRQSLAVATDRSQNFIIATGLIDEGRPHEAVYILDAASGILTAAIVNRQDGTFSQAYQRRIAADFGIAATGAQYMMVTGRTSFSTEPNARTCLYVAEVRSGRLVAYTFPWQGEMPGAGFGDFIKLGEFQFAVRK